MAGTDLTVVESKLDNIATSLGSIEDATQTSSDSLGDIETALETLASNSGTVEGGWSDIQVAVEDFTLAWVYGQGPAVDFGRVRSEFVVQYLVTYSEGDGWIVNLELSLDGEHWAPRYTATPYLAAWAGPGLVPVVNPATAILHFESPARYVRFAGDNRDTGSPVVTVLVAAR